MKKLLVLTTLLVGLLGFSAGAFAQALDICTTCKGGDVIGSVGCPQVGQTTCSNLPFNYQTRYGYTGESTVAIENSVYRAIFNICNCETAATSFVEGHRIGIRLTLLVNGEAGDAKGAYWADPTYTAVNFGAYATPAETCLTTAYASVTRTFGPGKYYKADGVTAITPTAGTACAVPTANRAVTLITDVTEGYTITADDVFFKLSRWWIILPNVRIDPTILKNGEVISVRIETLDQATGGICATCVATCVCTIEIARVCPTGTTGSSCLFPYFTSTGAATPANPFWNGIAIVNTGSTAGMAILKVYQQDGKTGTFNVPVAGGSMYVAALENIGFTGEGLGNGPVYIKVTSDFSGLDGFAMIANSESGESMGYLCRKP